MQSSTIPSPFRLPPAEPRYAAPRQKATGNEFSSAVAKLIERRGRIVVERPPLPPRIDPGVEDLDAPRRRWWPRSRTARGALVALPAIALAVSAAWLFAGGATTQPVRSSRATLPRPAAPVAAPVATPLAVAVPAPNPSRAEDPPIAALPSPPVPDPAPAAATNAAPPPTTPLTRDEVREIQSRLTALGFATGPADGVAGPRTQAALQRYVEARRLPGRELDRTLLRRLRADSGQAR